MQISATYKIVRLSLKFHPRNYKSNHISSNMKIDDGTKFKNYNQRCNGNIIYSLVTFSRIVLIHAINTTTKYKIILLSFELHQQNCKDNHMSLYINLDDGTVFPYLIGIFNGNMIHSLVAFFRVVPIHATYNYPYTCTTKYMIV